jgi:hypothetical protein
MNLNEMFPSNYLTKEDLSTPRRLVISNVTKKEVWRKNGKQLAVILHFSGNVKPLVLNKTNAIVIARIYGNDTTLWTNKPIDVYHDPNVMLGRDRVGGLRVRAAGVVPAKVAPATTTTAAISKPSKNGVGQP